MTLVAIVAGLTTDHLLPLPVVPVEFKALRVAAAALLAAVAGGLLVADKCELRKHRTTANPYRPSTAVVSTGIYRYTRYTRNPIYVALMLAVAAVAVGADTAWLFAALLPLFLLLHLGVVKREERYLAEKFGTTYGQYLLCARRWL
jgi:protein-S-isoprenylcysteine O-methyltransferase Ste14